MIEESDSKTGAAKHSATIQTAIAIAVIGLVLIGCVLILVPFSSAILWAILLSFSTWGIFCQLRMMLGGRSSLAALMMTLLLAAIVVAPFIVVGDSLADNVTDVIEVIRHLFTTGPPAPPRWLIDVPVIGPHLQDYLKHLASDPAAQKSLLQDFISPLKSFALELGKALGHGIFE